MFRHALARQASAFLVTGTCLRANNPGEREDGTARVEEAAAYRKTLKVRSLEPAIMRAGRARLADSWMGRRLRLSLGTSVHARGSDYGAV
jgi:hypothetical protein